MGGGDVTRDGKAGCLFGRVPRMAPIRARWDGVAVYRHGKCSVVITNGSTYRVILNLVQHLYVGVYWGARYDL